MPQTAWDFTGLKPATPPQAPTTGGFDFSGLKPAPPLPARPVPTTAPLSPAVRGFDFTGLRPAPSPVAPVTPPVTPSPRGLQPVAPTDPLRAGFDPTRIGQVPVVAPVTAPSPPPRPLYMTPGDPGALNVPELPAEPVEQRPAGQRLWLGGIGQIKRGAATLASLPELTGKAMAGERLRPGLVSVQPRTVPINPEGGQPLYARDLSSGAQAPCAPRPREPRLEDLTRDAVSDLVEGTFTTMLPVLPFAAVTAPLITAITLGSSSAASAAAEQAAQAAGYSTSAVRLAGNVAAAAAVSAGAGKLLTRGVRKAVRASADAIGAVTLPPESAVALKVLGLTRDTAQSTEAIRSAFLTRAKATHPDVNPDPAATAQFIEAKAAYDWIVDHPPAPSLAAAWRAALLQGLDRWTARPATESAPVAEGEGIVPVGRQTPQPAAPMAPPSAPRPPGDLAVAPVTTAPSGAPGAMARPTPPPVPPVVPPASLAAPAAGLSTAPPPAPAAPPPGIARPAPPATRPAPGRPPGPAPPRRRRPPHRSGSSAGRRWRRTPRSSRRFGRRKGSCRRPS